MDTPYRIVNRKVEVILRVILFFDSVFKKEKSGNFLKMVFRLATGTFG